MKHQASTLETQYDLIAHRFHVLSEPVRLRLLQALKGEAHTVGELVEVLQMPQPTISKHLKILKDAGLLTRRQVGVTVYYAIADKEILQVCDIMCASLERSLRHQLERTRSILSEPTPGDAGGGLLLATEENSWTREGEVWRAATVPGWLEPEG